MNDKGWDGEYCWSWSCKVLLMIAFLCLDHEIIWSNPFDFASCNILCNFKRKLWALVTCNSFVVFFVEVLWEMPLATDTKVVALSMIMSMSQGVVNFGFLVWRPSATKLDAMAAGVTNSSLIYPGIREHDDKEADEWHQTSWSEVSKVLLLVYVRASYERFWGDRPRGKLRSSKKK